VLPLARLPGVCGPLVPGGLVELLVPPCPTAPPTLLPEEPEPGVLGGKVWPEVVPGFVAALGVPSVPDGPVEVLVPAPGEAGVAVCAQAEPPASTARTVATDRILFIFSLPQKRGHALGNRRGRVPGPGKTTAQNRRGGISVVLE
jgi:hypothetical protein